MDLHRRRSHVAVLDGRGREVLSQRITNVPATFLELLAAIGGESKVSLEATYGWEWRLLEDAGYELHLAHPLRTKAIAAARVKTDSVDARILAHLLRARLAPRGLRGPRELRDLGELLRHRWVLVRCAPRSSAGVHGLIACHGILPGYGELFGKGGGASSRGSSCATTSADDSTARSADRGPRPGGGDGNSEIEQRAREDRRVRVPTQIRGVAATGRCSRSPRSGTSPRFPKAHRLWAPAHADDPGSDGRAQPATSRARARAHPALGARRVGPDGCHRPSPLLASLERIAKRPGRKIAKVALAPKILTFCYYGLRGGEIHCPERGLPRSGGHAGAMSAALARELPTLGRARLLS